MMASVKDMKVSRIYPLLVAKAERKGRTKAEVDEIIQWLTGYEMGAVDQEMTYAEFLDKAPAYNPGAERITGSVCGVKVETIDDPLMKKIRQLDKMIDELAKGKPMEKILREKRRRKCGNAGSAADLSEMKTRAIFAEKHRKRLTKIILNRMRGYRNSFSL